MIASQQHTSSHNGITGSRFAASRITLWIGYEPRRRAAGQRAPEGTTAWTGKYPNWAEEQRFEHAPHEATVSDYLHEVEHAAGRIERLEQAIDTAVQGIPEPIHSVVEGCRRWAGLPRSRPWACSRSSGSCRDFPARGS